MISTDSAANPIAGETLRVKSLLSEQSLQLLITEMPRTYAGFAKLGVVLTIMLGAGVADLRVPTGESLLIRNRTGS